jgi:hypothetical protein
MCGLTLFFFALAEAGDGLDLGGEDGGDVEFQPSHE